MAINYKRTVDTRSPETFIVIAVEGAITEPKYFEKIRDELKNGNIKLEILPPLNGASHPKNRLAELLSKLKIATSDSSVNSAISFLFMPP